MPAALQGRETSLQLKPLMETAIRQRPQLLALRELVDRSGKTIELARKDYYPDFDVKFAYGQRDRRWMVCAAMTC